MNLNKKNLWALKTVSEDERSYISIESYADEITHKYAYDSNVANSKQLKHGDIILLVNKEIILGAATISRIAPGEGRKQIMRCPECASTNITDRKTRTPRYKCNHGHEFANAEVGITDIRTYEAYYGESFVDLSQEEISLNSLRPYYDRNYNRNMSIQHLSFDVDISSLSEIIGRLSQIEPYPDSNDAEDIEEPFDPTGERSKKKVYRQITARRGQKKFRDKLRIRYNDTCVVTGSRVIEIIEAAHIVGYRDERDNDPQNGLLLRADIHTLFDLDLIGINPETLTIHISTSLRNSEYDQYHGSSLIISGRGPNKNALEQRWLDFINNNPS